MAETFNCTGKPWDLFTDIPDDVFENSDYESKAWMWYETECGNELEVRGSTGMAHVGMVAADFWCDECGEHYTAAESRAKWRNQQDD